MLARLSTTTLHPDRVDVDGRSARDVSLPMFRERDGFMGWVMLRNGHEGLVLTSWRDQDAIDALETSPSYRDTVEQSQEADVLAGS